MKEIYDRVSGQCSRLITQQYSTSFSLGIRVFHSRFREPIYGIYGFVRLADEIVDTFHEYDKSSLMDQFRRDTHQSIRAGISLNPILHSFQKVVRQYGIEHELIDAFLDSMVMDLTYVTYDREAYRRYIYGSAEVVGLMCLRVFTEGNTTMYDELKESACRLGSAFQKVNFLRDLRSDFYDRGRVYFPAVHYESFGSDEKDRIQREIEEDFTEALQGIVRLPRGTKLGVYLAYQYYIRLLNKIKSSSVDEIREKRIRVPDIYKLFILATTTLKYQFRII